MKKHLSLAFALALALLASGCPGLQPAAVDVTGVWIGTFYDASAPGMRLGKAIYRLTQADDGSVTGEVYFRYDPPSDDNLSVFLTGKTSGNALTIKRDAAPADHLKATIEGDALTAGSYTEDGKVVFTMDATRLPTTVLNAVPLFRYDLFLEDTAYPGYPAFDGTSYWFLSGSQGHIVSSSGTQTATFPLESNDKTVNGACWDGSRMLCVLGDTLYSVDSDGTLAIVLPSLPGFPTNTTETHGLAYAKDSYWFVDYYGYSRIDSCGQDGTRGTGISLPSVLTGVAADSSYLYILECYPQGVIIKVDIASGSAVAAYAVMDRSGDGFHMSRILMVNGELVGAQRVGQQNWLWALR